MTTSELRDLMLKSNYFNAILLEQPTQRLMKRLKTTTEPSGIVEFFGNPQLLTQQTNSSKLPDFSKGRG